MREKIKKFLKILEPYRLLIDMIVALIVGIGVFYKLLFSPPDLIVKVDKENINYPSSINNTYLDIYNYVQDSTHNANLKVKSTELLNYLFKTQHQRILDIRNNTNKIIKSVNIRFMNVRGLTSWSVSSSYLLENEIDKLLKNILFEKSSGIVYFKDAVDLPPSGDLKLYLWGEFNNNDWIESLLVDYDGGSAKIQYNKSFSGLKAVMAEYSFEFFLFLIATFILIFHLQTKKYVNPKKNLIKPD